MDLTNAIHDWQSSHTVYTTVMIIIIAKVCRLLFVVRNEQRVYGKTFGMIYYLVAYKIETGLGFARKYQ